MGKSNKPFFPSSEAAWKELTEEIFPTISTYIRLLKTSTAKQDEYVVIRSMWSDDDPLFVPQVYREDRDINDMLLAKDVPTTVLHAGKTDHDNPTILKMGVLAHWRSQPETQMNRLTGFCYSPGGEDIVNGELNMYRDVSVPAIEPPEGALDLIITHVRDHLCDGREEYATYLLHWLAHLIQHTAERPGVGIAVIGEQGTGKGLFIEFIKLMLGGARNCNTTASASDTKSFNAAIGKKLFVVFDEATFAGDRQQSDFMKKLITEPRIRIEQKGVDAFEVDNFARVFITSNNMTSAVPATLGDRRWLIIECKAVVERSFLDQLVVFTQDPLNASYFKHYLQTLPLDNFNPKHVPIQDTGFENKLQGLYKTNPLAGFLWEWLTAKDLTLFRSRREHEDGAMAEFEVPLSWQRKVDFQDFYEVFKEACTSNYGPVPGKGRMGRLMAQYGLVIIEGAARRRYVLLPHPTAVLNVLKRSARFDWPITPHQQHVIDTTWADKVPDVVGTMIYRDLTKEEEARAEAADEETQQALNDELNKLFGISQDLS